MNKVFWVIEWFTEAGNSKGYFEDLRRLDSGGLDTYWTKDIHKALQFDNKNSAQTTLDDSIDHAIGDRAKSCKVIEHAWILPDELQDGEPDV